MATAAVWWTRGRGEIRVKRRKTPRVHCVECEMSLTLPDVHEGDRIECTGCGTIIVIGGKRSRQRKRPRIEGDVPRPTQPLSVAARCLAAAGGLVLVGWYVLEPEPFVETARAIAAEVQESWARLRGFIFGG